MSEERLLKRGRFAELEDNKKAKEAAARSHLQTLKNLFSEPENFPLMDLEQAEALVKDLKVSQAQVNKERGEIEKLRKELGLV